MYRKKIIVGVLLALLSVKAFPQSVTLDEAIKTTATELGQQINANKIPTISSSNQSIEQTAEEIRRQLTAQTKIAVLNFSSNWRELSAYVIDELNNAIVRGGSLTVVDRQQLDLVRKEKDFQMSGDVDDESAQSAGKLLGAQSVLSGSFTEIGKNMYRFRVRVIAVETGVLQYSNSIEIKKDRVLTALMPKGSKTAKASGSSRESIKVRPLANFSAGIGGGNFSGILLPIAGIQAGVVVNSFSFLLDVNGAMGVPLTETETDSDINLIYNLGGIIEYSITDLVFGAGGGIGGLNDYSYPYIRGSVSFLFLDSYLKVGLYYDYNFDYGFNVGLRFHGILVGPQ
jgi:TolB-like protein